VRYLNSEKENKQQIALEIAAQDGIVEGPIFARSARELCRSCAIKRNPQTQRPALAMAPRKCLFLYHYQMHPVFGFLSVRLQTWFPFPVHIYLNGREWLARKMDQAGIGYRRHDNCFHLDRERRTSADAHERAAKNELGPVLRSSPPAGPSAVVCRSTVGRTVAPGHLTTRAWAFVAMDYLPAHAVGRDLRGRARIGRR